MLVLEDFRAHFDEPGRGIDDAVVVVLTGRDTGRHEKRLHRGAGLEHVGRGAIAVHARCHVLAIVRVVRRLVHHGENLAGADVDHDNRTCGGALIANGGLQLPIGEILDTQVDRQYEVATGAGRPDAVDVLNDVSVSVLDDPLGAILAGKPMIECKLQAFLPGIVYVGEPEDVPRDFSRWIVPTVLTRQVNARNSERLDPLCFGRGTTASEIKEVAIEVAGDAAGQILPIELQSGREARQLIRR